MGPKSCVKIPNTCTILGASSLSPLHGLTAFPSPHQFNKHISSPSSIFAPAFSLSPPQESFATQKTNMKTTRAEFGIQMPEPAKPDSTQLSSGPLLPLAETTGLPPPPAEKQRRWDVAAAGLRIACAVSSVISLSLMVTAEERGKLSVFGLEIPLLSSWSYSSSLEYLVGVSAAVIAHSVMQLLLIARRKLMKKGPTVPSRCHLWILFVGDQAFAYAMISAGSAAAGVTNLNRTGVRHAALPNFCKPLPRFCDHMAMSITFAFFSFVLLATSAVLDVLWLAN